MRYGFSSLHLPMKTEVYSMTRNGPAGLQAIGKEEIELAILFVLPLSLWNDLGKVTGLFSIFIKICHVHSKHYFLSTTKIVRLILFITFREDNY